MNKLKIKQTMNKLKKNKQQHLGDNTDTHMTTQTYT